MNLYNSETIKTNVTIRRYLKDQDAEVQGNRAVAKWRGGERMSVSIDDGKGLFYDHAANEGGSVIDLCMKMEGLDATSAIRTLGDRYHLTPVKASRKSPSHSYADALKSKGYAHTKTYTYTDEAGTPTHYVERWESENADGKHEKTFCQYRIENGNRINGLDGLATPLYNLVNVANADGDIYLVEGEKDADTLNERGLVATTSTCGYGGWKPHHAAYLKGKKVVVIADNDEPGQRGAMERAKALAHVAASVKVITVSKLPKGDVTDWMEREGGTVEKLREIVAKTAPFGVSAFERFGQRVDGDTCDGCDTYGREIEGINGCGSFFVTVNAGRETIRDAVSRNSAEIVKRIVETKNETNSKGDIGLSRTKLHEIENVISVLWLRSRGKLFWNSQTKLHSDSLFFDSKPGLLYRITSDIFQSWIANLTDIGRSEKQFKMLISLIEDAALSYAAAGVIPSKYYERKGDALYVSNGDSDMVRITATEIRTVRNGTDNVVFLEGATLPKWKLLDGEGEDPFNSSPLFKNASYTSESGKMLIRLWYLGLFAKMPKRPPLLITGPYRSGKTKLFDGIERLLANRPEANAEITDTPQGKIDFWTAIHAGGLYCIDNADTKVSWLTDTLQRISTGSALPKRKLYRDDALVCLYPNADIVVTSNNPQFADDCGLSDRFIIVRLMRSNRESQDAALDKDILARRDAALTWTVRTLQRALAMRPDEETGGRINGRHPDFATFALRCADAMGMRKEAEAALMEAEIDKCVIVLQNSDVASKIFDFLFSVKGKWEGSASDLACEIWTGIKDDLDELAKSGRIIANCLKTYNEQFQKCFRYHRTQTHKITVHHFGGIDPKLSSGKPTE